MKKNLLSTLLIFFTISLFAQLNIEHLGFLPYTQDLSDVWGYVDKEGNEYALVGVQNGLSIVDVTNPSQPTEVFFGPGVNSIWRDIKTWGDYAYVSTEGGNGIYIVDLSPLPGNITVTTSFTGTIYPFSTVHNLYVDETGKLYIFGANNGNGGAIICDLVSDPMNPVELGRFDDYYFHDGMARGDTLWGGAIYEGFLAAVDVSDPANPQVMATKSTPNQFTHNVWVSDDGTHVFTTDEVGSGFIGAYDVSDFDNIIETDRIQSNPGNNVIPHNVHVLNDYLITSYYSDGVTIHDAARPSNLIEVGNYDTSPNFPGPGYHGSWGVYPFLPSGKILASDIEEGLYILAPDYKRGCYLEGTVIDSITGLPINNVAIKIASTEIMDVTDFSGNYAFGTPTAGTYNIEFSHDGYNPKTIESAVLENGVITNINVELSSWFTDVKDNSDFAEVKVGPNPFSNTIKVVYKFNNKLSSNASIIIYSMEGKPVEEIHIANIQDVVLLGAELKSGVYYMHINNGEEFSKPVLIRKL